jgi:hypothetical protein
MATSRPGMRELVRSSAKSHPPERARTPQQMATSRGKDMRPDFGFSMRAGPARAKHFSTSL